MQPGGVPHVRRREPPWSNPGAGRKSLRIVKLRLSYDGTSFVGWQRQETGDSVQGLLEEALGRIEGAAP